MNKIVNFFESYNMEEVIKLTVGGIEYNVMRETLEKAPDNTFLRYIVDNKLPKENDNSGDNNNNKKRKRSTIEHYMQSLREDIYRDGEAFKHVLHYLDYETPFWNSSIEHRTHGEQYLNKRLEKEFKFYGIHAEKFMRDRFCESDMNQLFDNKMLWIMTVKKFSIYYGSNNVVGITCYDNNGTVLLGTSSGGKLFIEYKYYDNGCKNGEDILELIDDKLLKMFEQLNIVIYVSDGDMYDGHLDKKLNSYETYRYLPEVKQEEFLDQKPDEFLDQKPDNNVDQQHTVFSDTSTVLAEDCERYSIPATEILSDNERCDSIMV